ncbi:MAG: 3,4-dihydroxy-2-butanone-4-phosphate synthase [Solirubrobacterales bacterium]|nr:3,4-dihydroxy-2-butanone-4-phosphate synthase [Solirubrobacterales bacterium]
MSTLEQATARFAERDIVLVGEEGDGTIFLACPADGVDASRLARLHELGRGMVVLGLPEPVARRLALPAPWRGAGPPGELALTAPIDATAGIEGGWSLEDRALTMRVAADPDSRSSDLTIPGHVYPALVGEPPEHGPSAALELARLSGRAPAVALCAVLDRRGRAASLRDARADERFRRLPVAPAAELRSGWITRHAGELSISCSLPTRGAAFRAVGYAPAADDPPTVALVHGDPASCESPLVHVHVGCLFGDAFGSLLCDCRSRLDHATSEIARAGAGVIIYAKPKQPTPIACVRDEPIDAASVAGLLRAVGVSELRLVAGGRHERLSDELRGCGLTVAR